MRFRGSWVVLAAVLISAAPPVAVAKARQPAITIAVRGAQVLEGNDRSNPSTVLFTVKLAGEQKRSVSIDYATVAGTAGPTTDFEAITGTLLLTPDRPTHTLAVRIAADSQHEAPRLEDFRVVVSSRNNKLSGSAAAVIVDDDMPSECSAVGAASRMLDCEVPLEADGRFADISRKVRLLLPTRYDHLSRWPSVYLLHGVADRYTSWVDMTDVEDFADGALIVMPDASTVVADGVEVDEPGWYSDWVDEHDDYAWESFHTDRLVRWVDDHFASLGDGHRGIAGNSMGGFGAVYYAGSHPGVFAAAVSLSGVLDTQLYGPAEGYAFELGARETPFGSLGTPDRRVWGDPIEMSDNWARHNPRELARLGDLARYSGKLWLRTGTGTPTRPGELNSTLAARGPIEQFVFQTNQSFLGALKSSALPGQYAVDYEAYPGIHDWEYWNRELSGILPALVAAIG